MRITHIFFDWSGTLAFSGSKKDFINGAGISTLYPDSIAVLNELRRRGYVLGLIVNTSKSPIKFRSALKSSGLMPLFNGPIILSSDPGSCKKPCKGIFKKALGTLNPKATLMVGNDLQKDIYGAKMAGMQTFHINRPANQSLLDLLVLRLPPA